MAIKAALFDLDGTLLNTLSDLTDSVNYMLTSYGLPTHSEEEIRSFVGNGVRNLILRSLPEGCTDEFFEEALAVYKAHYAKNSANKTAPYNGVPEMLNSLHNSGIKLAIVSNKHDEATQELSRAYFGDIIDCTVGNCDFLEKKPAPDMAEYAMKKLGVSKEESVFIGDSETDILTAKNAGITCISVTWGFRDRDVLTEVGAEMFVDTADELIEIIKSL